MLHVLPHTLKDFLAVSFESWSGNQVHANSSQSDILLFSLLPEPMQFSFEGSTGPLI